jgi:hypothetical protein
MTSEKQDSPQTTPAASQDKLDKNIQKLGETLERLYGGIGTLVWRNFIAGFMRAIGLVLGYVVILTIGILIAHRLGVFKAAKNFWDTFAENLPFSQLKQLPELEQLKFDPALFQGMPKTQEATAGATALPSPPTP